MGFFVLRICKLDRWQKARPDPKFPDIDVDPAALCCMLQIDVLMPKGLKERDNYLVLNAVFVRNDAGQIQRG